MGEELLVRGLRLVFAVILVLCLCSGQRCDLTPIVDALQTGNSPFDDEFDFFG